MVNKYSLHILIYHTFTQLYIYNPQVTITKHFRHQVGMFVSSSNQQLSSEAKTLQGLARNSEAMQGYLQLRAAAPRLFTGHWLKVGLTAGVP